MEGQPWNQDLMVFLCTGVEVVIINAVAFVLLMLCCESNLYNKGDSKGLEVSLMCCMHYYNLALQYSILG